MKSISLIAFLSFVLLTGCIDTDGVLELRGKVLDANTKAPISNRKVVIQALVNSRLNG